MDQQTLRDLVYSRVQFFSRIHMFRRRDQIMDRFLRTEARYLDLLSRENRTPVTITFPITLGNNFMDAVPVLASAQQITDEIQDYSGPSQQSCSICQDAIASDGARLRVCQHVYHRACIRTWFDASVRCPVCRRDIREGPATGTSSGATGTQPLQTSQWGGEESQE